MEIVLPMVFNLLRSGLQIISHVTADRDTEHQRYAYPKRSVQIGLRFNMMLQIIHIHFRSHAGYYSLDDGVRIYVEKLLEIL